MGEFAGKLPSFLGLKWKAVLLVCAVGMFATSSFALVIRRSLQSQTFLQEQRLHQEEVREVEALLAGLFRHCESTAEMIPSLEGMGEALNGSSPLGVSERFARHGERLRKTCGIGSAVLLDAAGRPIGAWGDDRPSSPAWPVGRNAWPGAVSSQNGSVHRVWCDERQCRVESAVPLKTGSNGARSALLSASLKNLVLAAGLRCPTKAAIVLVVPPGRVPSAGEDSLPEWRATAVAFGEDALVRAVLRSAAAAHPQAVGRHTGVLVRTPRETYRVGFVPLEAASDGGTSAYFVTVTDATWWAARTCRSVVEALLLGVVAILAASALTLGFLWHPMRRIVRVADALGTPAAARRYEEAERLLLRDVRARRLRDETDLLANAGVDLVRSLQSGEQDVKLMLDHWRRERETSRLREAELEQKTRDLAALAKEMEDERQATSALLDAAPFALVVHSPDGELVLANRFAQELAGFEGPELHERGFAAFAGSGNSAAIPRGRLEEVLQGAKAEFRYRVTMASALGPKTLEWRHRRLERPNDQGGTDVLLMSIGLDVEDEDRMGGGAA